MQISELTFGFIASYMAGVLPSLNEIRSEVDKKTLQDHVEICFDETRVSSCFINNRECRSLARERTLWEKHARNTGTGEMM